MAKILVIDGSYQAFRHIMSCVNDEKYNVNFISYRLMRTILKEVTAYNAYPIICFDKNGSKYRSSIYSDYKGNRGAKEDRIEDFIEDGLLPDSFKGKKIFDETIPLNEFINYWNSIKGVYKDDKKDYIESVRGVVIFRTYKHIRKLFTDDIRSIGILGLTIPGYEADDIGYLFSYLTNTTGRLVSDDNDWRISVSERYELYRPMAEELVTYDKMIDDYKDLTSKGIRANEASRLVKTIVGDGGDNIPGFEGVGGVRGKSMLNMIYESDSKVDYSNILTVNEACILYKYIMSNNLQSEFNSKLLNDLYNKVLSSGKSYDEIEDYNILDKIQKFKRSLIKDFDRFELNYKLVGFDHLYDDMVKSYLLETINNELKTVKPISQLGYIKFCVMLDSATLKDEYQDLKSILDKNIITHII